MIENWQVEQRLALPLDVKIEMSKRRIREWYEYWNSKVYVSFSGGKDSLVLLNLVRSIYDDVPVVFFDTGLEFPEIRKFVKTFDDVIWIKPKRDFRYVIEKFGYPVVSKEVASKIYTIRNTKSNKMRYVRLWGKKYPNGRTYGKIAEKWKFLLNAPFKISSHCCNVLKKYPAKTYEKKTERKPFIGTKLGDSYLRRSEYYLRGCNNYDSGRPSSKPISFWTDENIWEYIKIHNLEYSEIYDKGYENTGCFLCLFGIYHDPERFDRLKKTHPKIYDFCVRELKYDEVLEFLKCKN